jgi:hypothetical protein
VIIDNLSCHKVQGGGRGHRGPRGATLLSAGLQPGS